MLAPEGWPFVLGGAAFAVVVYLLWPRGVPLAALGLLLALFSLWFFRNPDRTPPSGTCLLYTSDAADDLLCVDLGGRRIIKKKKINNTRFFFFSSRRRHTRSCLVSWARRCV